MKTVLKIILGIIGAFVIMGVLFAGCTAFVFNGVDDDNTEEVKNKGNTETTTIDENKDVPREYQNALTSAEMYQETLPMSDNELFEQLTSDYGDKFTEEQAQYAIDNLDK